MGVGVALALVGVGIALALVGVGLALALVGVGLALALVGIENFPLDFKSKFIVFTRINLLLRRCVSIEFFRRQEVQPTNSAGSGSVASQEPKRTVAFVELLKHKNEPLGLVLKGVSPFLHSLRYSLIILNS